MTAPPPPARRAAVARSIIGGIGLAAAALAVTALVVEGAARALAGREGESVGGDRQLWTYDRTKGWFHAPRATGTCFMGGPDRGRIRINGLGLRGPEVTRAKPAGTRRVLVFGDSFAFGVGVDEEHLFTSHLGRLLGPRYEVINMGVSGYSTDQEYLLLAELGRQLSPDLVLLLACDNDFEANLQELVYLRYYKPFFLLGPDGALEARNIPVPRLSRLQAAKAWLAERSSAWNALRHRRSDRPYVRKALAWLEVAPAWHSSADDMVLTAALVAAMRDLAEAGGARFLLLNTGHRGERTVLFHDLRRRLATAGVAFYGLEGHLGAARQRAPDRHWDFPQDTHWNVDSHQAAAEIVHLHLKRTGMLD